MESECIDIRKSPDKEEKKRLADRRLVLQKHFLNRSLVCLGADQGKEDGKPSVTCDVLFEGKKKSPFLGFTWRTFRSTRQPGSSACAVSSWRCKGCQ